MSSGFTGAWHFICRGVGAGRWEQPKNRIQELETEDARNDEHPRNKVLLTLFTAFISGEAGALFPQKNVEAKPPLFIAPRPVKLLRRLSTEAVPWQTFMHCQGGCWLDRACWLVAGPSDNHLQFYVKFRIYKEPGTWFFKYFWDRMFGLRKGMNTCNLCSINTLPVAHKASWELAVWHFLESKAVSKCKDLEQAAKVGRLLSRPNWREAHLFPSVWLAMVGFYSWILWDSALGCWNEIRKQVPFSILALDEEEDAAAADDDDGDDSNGSDDGSADMKKMKKMMMMVVMKMMILTITFDVSFPLIVTAPFSPITPGQLDRVDDDDDDELPDLEQFRLFDGPNGTSETKWKGAKRCTGTFSLVDKGHLGPWQGLLAFPCLSTLILLRPMRSKTWGHEMPWRQESGTREI